MDRRSNPWCPHLVSALSSRYRDLQHAGWADRRGPWTLGAVFHIPVLDAVMPDSGGAGIDGDECTVFGICPPAGEWSVGQLGPDQVLGADTSLTTPA